MLYKKDAADPNHHFLGGLFLQGLSYTWLPAVGHISETILFAIGVGNFNVEIFLEACKQNRGAQHGFGLMYDLTKRMYKHEPNVYQRQWDMTMRMQRGNDVGVVRVSVPRSSAQTFYLTLSSHSEKNAVTILKSKDKAVLRKIALDHNRDLDRMVKSVIDHYLRMNECTTDDMLIYYMQHNPQKSWCMTAAASMYQAVSQDEKGSAVRAQAGRLAKRR
jgi:hypothetical protein